jgi:uncharacterized protein YabE (DUF348 family)
VPRSILAMLVQALVVTALVGGTTAFVAFDRSVTISVDGKQHQVHSFARNVGDLLEGEGIQVDEHDLVTPSLDEGFSDGDTVLVRYGRPVLLTVDDSTRTVWTTARTVDEALMMFGIRAEGAYVSASRSRRISPGGLELDVRLPHRVTVLADGKVHDLTTTAFTVRDALAEAGVRVRRQDRVTPDLESRPGEEQVVAVSRVDGKRVVEEKPIAFKTIKRKTDELYAGTTKVLREGKVGLRVRVFRETFVDKKLTSRRLVRERIAAKPVTEIVLVGTKPVPQNSPTADGLNWAALAECESGGNPQAYNPAGPYYGLYQFSLSTWQAVGGSGLPSENSSAEQTYRAQILYRQSGAGQWPVCGSRLFT